MRTFEFYNLDREVFFSDTEDLEVTEDRLFRLRVSVNLDTEEVALVLPIQFTLGEPHVRSSYGLYAR